MPTPDQKPKLSVTLIVKNEERDLPACLASVAFADEIVVVDAQSTDRTCQIARAAGAKVFVNPWPGFAAQKAFALEKATGDWVLNLDADERCSPRLREMIGQALEDSAFDAYQLPFETWAFGRRLRFGEVHAERHLRLFRRDQGHYPRREVHEGVEVTGPVGALDGVIVHHTYDSLEEYLDKLNRYSSAGALERQRQGARFSRWALWRWPYGFLRRYFFQRGLLDGYAGLVFALLGGLYDFLKVAKLDDLERAEKRNG